MPHNQGEKSHQSRAVPASDTGRFEQDHNTGGYLVNGPDQRRTLGIIRELPYIHDDPSAIS
jgi:hypothetical protein